MVLRYLFSCALTLATRSVYRSKNENFGNGEME